MDNKKMKVFSFNNNHTKESKFYLNYESKIFKNLQYIKWLHITKSKIALQQIKSSPSSEGLFLERSYG
jgi:hypothetical protein